MSIAHPWRMAILGLLVASAAAPGLLRLQLRTDGHALVPDDAPEVQFDQRVREEFGLTDPIVVLIRTDHPQGIFNVGTLKFVQALTERLAAIEGVREVDLFSLATERGDRVRQGTLNFRPFLDPMPETPEELDRLRDDLQAIELYTGTLVSYDERGTAVLVGVAPGADRPAQYRQIRRIVAEVHDGREEVHVIGAPVAEALLGTHILEDLGVPRSLLGDWAGPANERTAWRVPGNFHELRLLIAHHIGLVPVAIVVMMVVFLIAFRSPAAAILPLMEVGACLVFVFGLMGFAGVPVYLTTAVLPIILTAIGVADEIHIFTRYTQLLRQRPTDERLAVLRTAMAEMAPPVVKTSITTTVGFCSFVVSPLVPVQAFGVFTGIGILFCMLWSLTVIPALLTLAPQRWLVPRRPAPPPAEDQPRASALARLGAGVIRRRKIVLGATVLALVLVPFGVSRVDVQDSWIDGFAPDSDFYQATQLFNDQFLGTHLLLLWMDAGHYDLTGEIAADDVQHHDLTIPANTVTDPVSLKGDLLVLRRLSGRPPTVSNSRIRHQDEWSARIDNVAREGDRLTLTWPRRSGSPRITLGLMGPATVAFEITPQRMYSPDVINEIERLESFIAERQDCAVGGVLGTARYLATSSFMSSGRKEERRCVPDSLEGIRVAWNRYRLARGEDRLRQAVDADYARSIVTVFLENANFSDTSRLMTAIREFEAEHLAPEGIHLEFAGDVAVSQSVIDAIVTTQIRSLLLSLVGIVAVTALLGRSIGWGLCCVVPCALAVVFNFAIMGWIDMPLGVATSMFAGMTLGIGVDYAIHLLERYRHNRRTGSGLDSAVTDAVAVTGPAILVDALGVACGFGIMTLSQVPANARLGGLLVLSIAGCLLATLLVLPALLRTFARTRPRHSS